MKLYLVRHGESVGNKNQLEYFKKLDCNVELTEKGKLDAVNAANKIISINQALISRRDNVVESNTHFKLYNSSYLRAIDTANILRQTLTKNPNYRVEKQVESCLCRERHWGKLRDIVSKREHTDDHFNFYYKPENGESFADCFQRVAIFHQWMISNTIYENNIVVAHGEFNKLYLMYLLGWKVEEFENWKSPKNGEVFLIENGKLSDLTPLTIKH
jgi:broad specificity phosphatase PhoE